MFDIFKVVNELKGLRPILVDEQQLKTLETFVTYYMTIAENSVGLSKDTQQEVLSFIDTIWDTKFNVVGKESDTAEQVKPVVIRDSVEMLKSAKNMAKIIARTDCERKGGEIKNHYCSILLRELQTKDERIAELETENEKLINMLKEFLPMYYYDECENEHYIGGNFVWNEDCELMYDVMREFGYGKLLKGKSK